VSTAGETTIADLIRALADSGASSTTFKAELEEGGMSIVGILVACPTANVAEVVETHVGGVADAIAQLSAASESYKGLLEEEGY
jgi:hypothetical protein